VSDFKKVIDGQAQDVRLEPGDIVYVPPTHLSSWARMVDHFVPTITALQTGIVLGNTSGGSK
jgi:ribosomal protein L16 Arg81 hydroxylase